MNPKSQGASGSARITNGSMAQGYTLLVVDSPADFLDGQDIAVQLGSTTMRTTLIRGQGTTRWQLSDSAPIAMSNATIKHDDTSAVQRTLDVMADNGDPVTFSQGIYRIFASLTVQPAAHLRADGAAELLIDASVSNAINWTQSPEYPARRLRIEGLAFTHEGTGTILNLDESALAVPYPDTRIESCRFYVPAGATAIASTNQRQATIRDCEFFGPTGTPMGTGIQLIDSTNATIEGNVLYQLGTGILGPKGSSAVFSAGAQIQGNNIVNVGTCLNFDFWQLVQVIGNILDEADAPLAFTDVYDSIISGNWLGGTGLHNVLQLQAKTASVGQIVVTDNRITNYRTKAPNDASASDGITNVALFGTAGSPNNNLEFVTVHGNHIDEWYQIGIYSNLATDVDIEANMLSGTGSTAANQSAIYDGSAFSVVMKDNRVSGSIGWTGTGDVIEDNPGFNPTGLVTTPVMPASGTAAVNPYPYRCMVCVAGGTVSAIAIGDGTTGLTSGSFLLDANQSITLTYSAAPAWTWFGL